MLVPAVSSRIEIGQRFGRLTVISVYHDTETFRKIAECLCDCGKKKFIEVRNLQDGLTRSCGCLQKDTATTHGMKKHPLYRRWINMMSRCYNPHHKNYHQYGGRGITVCKRWHNVANYVSDMEKGYSDKMQVDRIDNSKGYSPENCKWVSCKVQQNNRRNNVRISFQGKTMTIAEWSNHLGILYITLYQRIIRGWPLDKALSPKS